VREPRFSRPTAGAPRASGNITNTGSQLPAGSTNYGTLTEVQGTIVGWTTYNSGCVGGADTLFNAAGDKVCAKGTAPVTTAGYYRVVWYDGAGAQVTTDGNMTANPTLQTGDLLLSTYGSAAPGTWHAVVYPNSGSVSPEASYAGTSQEIRANAAFTVTAAALPAFPTPLSALLASGGTGALYWFYRRRLFRARP